MKKIANLKNLKIITNFEPTNILHTTHFICRKCHDVYLANKKTVNIINEIYKKQMNNPWNQSAYGTNCDFSEMDKYIKCKNCNQRMRNHVLVYEKA